MTRKRTRSKMRSDWGYGNTLADKKTVEIIPGAGLAMEQPGTFAEDPAHEVHKLRAALAEARVLVAALSGDRVVIIHVEDGDLIYPVCAACRAEAENMLLPVVHEADCLVLRARAWLEAQKGEDDGTKTE